MSDGVEQARQAGPTLPEEERPVGGQLPIVLSAHCSRGPTSSACPMAQSQDEEAERR